MGGVGEAEEVRAEGRSSERVRSGRNGGKLCNGS